MALSERVTQQHEVNNGGLPCSVGALLAQLEGDELAALVAMLGTPENRGWTEQQVFDAVTAEGYKIRKRSINHHRGGRCRCPKA